MNKIYPGSKVKMLEHIIHAFDHDIGAYEVVATKDSIGIILSYEEYSARVNEGVKDDVFGNHRYHATKHLAWVKSVVTTRTHYAVRLEEVVPLSDDDYAKLKQVIDHLEVSCRVGATHIILAELIAII